ncbi:MAG TPA: LPS export ABC transporter periplasmic protein LptC [Blastocatellia bacterium]|jgi:lipopolysaccharide export system protein LptA|nr:LPS export ABC transporter periplasmic protein LptC [Blastocatellia bacterium]HAF23572.1 LPS export ABC transporter periplasmic protein LptC [Blastocatellia bacterium]HCX30214.1 LPS export ABC transporter periplasmic protein LptC [Blastocatellia bacterium]
MQEVTRKRAIAIGLRARAPLVARAGALLILAAAVIFVAVSYYRLRNNKPFRLRSETPELSKEITGIIEGYEQRVMKGDRLYLLLRASRDVTFSDGHHELDQVNLAVYPPVGEKPDQIAANKAIYDQKNSVITFLGNVKVETKDNLKVNTESIAYDQNSEVAQTDAPVSFDRENVSGHSTGAIVFAKTKKLDLKKDVEITVAPEVLKNPQAKPASSRSRPVTIRSAQASFEQEAMELIFVGGVTAEQDRDLMSGDNLYATLNEQKHLQKLEVRGNSYLRTMTEGRAAEVHSVDMDFFMDKDQRLERAVAMRNAGGKTLDADSDLQLTGANLIEVLFQAQADRSLLKQMRTEGRSVVNLSAPKSKANDPRAANKRLTADAVKLMWRVTGRDLDKAEAVGNAEVFVEPVIKNAKADTKTLTAPRIDCDFFETGNLTRSVTATGGAKAVIEPVQKVENRGTRVLTSQIMTAGFVKDTQDVERMDAQGDAKFNENDRNGVAANISYTAADNTVRFRGGEPTVWDSRARTKAIELDSDLTSHISYSRGKTATTYYSQEQTNGAMPFSRVKSPVYIVSDKGEFNRDSGLAIYTGNARAWQDDNFVRADKLTIYVNDKKMDADGGVQSEIYNARRKVGATSTTIPVFASSDSMFYSDPNRLLHYEGDVDIRQGTDRITSGVADVYLYKDSSEVEKTIAQRNVVLTQPNRKGTGDWVQYTSADEVAILKGNPAKVEDAEKGSTEGGRLTVNMRDGRVTADDVRGPQSPGRVKSVHKVKKQ